MENNENLPTIQKSSIESIDGKIVPKNIDEAYRYSVAIAKSGLAPKHFDTAEKIMVAMQLAQELKLPPLTALKSMYVVNGTPALFGDLPLSLVRQSGLLEYIAEDQYDENDNLICIENKNLEAACKFASCKVKRKNEPEVTRVFTWLEAQSAGLDKGYENKPKATWKNYRKRMLQMRARSWALKDVFADVLMGIAIKEYDGFFDEKDVTPEKGPKKETETAKNLTDLLLNKK